MATGHVSSEVKDEVEVIAELAELEAELNATEVLGEDTDEVAEDEEEPKVTKVKSSKKEPDVTAKSLARELGVDPKVLRKKLRKLFSYANGRWEWEKDDPDLAVIRKAFKKTTK